MLHPGVLALTVSSAATAGVLLYASRWAAELLLRWDLRSGSARQLELERRTYLVSTLVGVAVTFEAASILLYVYVHDALAPLFTGAMCAAGTLEASPDGYRVLLLKLAAAVAAGLWLALQRADAKGWDYPLLRPKYALLLLLTPLSVAAAVLQARHFAALRPEVITSCCGSLFSAGGPGLAGSLGGLPPGPAGWASFGLSGAAAAAGLGLARTGRGAPALGLLAALALPAGVAATISLVSPYVYELPTHRCPFCLLQREYGHVGYALYGALLGGAVAGMAAGVLGLARDRPSIAEAVVAMQRRLGLAAAAGFGLAVALAGGAIALSGLRT